MTNENNTRDSRLHFVVATAIIVKYDHPDKKKRFLIIKRASHEKAFPDRWAVPGGKLVFHEYEHLPKTADYPQWYNVVDWVLRKEVKEETGLEIEKPNYLCDLVFVRPDGYPVVTLSYWAHHKNGEVVLSRDFTDHAWVTLEEAEKYDLIEGIYKELVMADKMLKGGGRDEWMAAV